MVPLLALWIAREPIVLGIPTPMSSWLQNTSRAPGWPLGLSLVFVLKSAFLFANSYSFGRLSIPPVYDDISYFTDAVERIAILRGSGVVAFLQNLIESPPHSPYATLGAIGAFLISGNKQIAPYMVNVAALAAITIFWLAIFRIGTIASLLVSVAIVTTGWFDHAVTVYHPDLIAGWGAAAVASVILFASDTLDTRARGITAGIAAGLVVMIKPTALPMVLILWSLSAFFSFLADWRNNIPLRQATITLIFPLFIATVVCGSYFFFQFGSILKYLHTVFFVQIDVWRPMSSGVNSLTFYAERLFELFSYWLVAVLAFPIVAVAAFRSRDYGLCIRLAGLVVCFVTSYAAASLSPVKLMLFGGVIYGVTIALVLVSLVYLALPAMMRQPEDGPSWRPKAVAALLFVTVGGGAGLSMKDRQLRFPDNFVDDMSKESAAIYTMIKEVTPLPEFALPGGRQLAALFPTPGPLPPTVYRFWGLSDLRNIAVTSMPFETDPKALLAIALESDFIVVPDDRLRAKLFGFPVNALLPALVDSLRSDTAFEEIGRVALHDGAELVFRRRSGVAR